MRRSSSYGETIWSHTKPRCEGKIPSQKTPSRSKRIQRKPERRIPSVATLVPEAKHMMQPNVETMRTKTQTNSKATNSLRPPSSDSQASSFNETQPDHRSNHSTKLEKKEPPHPAPLKREHSDIFRSFSKPEPKIRRENTSRSAEPFVPAKDVVRTSVCLTACK